MIFQLTHVHLRLLEALMSSSQFLAYIHLYSIYLESWLSFNLLGCLLHVRFNLAIRWWLFDLEIVYMCYLHVIKLDFHIQIVKKIASKKKLWRKLTTWSRLSRVLLFFSFRETRGVEFWMKKNCFVDSFDFHTNPNTFNFQYNFLLPHFLCWLWRPA